MCIRDRYCDPQPIIVQDRTLVPLRVIFEKVGAKLEWDDSIKTVKAVYEGKSILLPVGSNSATVNGETVALDVPAQIVESRTMVPARFIAESLGCTVTWDNPTRTVVITK